MRIVIVGGGDRLRAGAGSCSWAAAPGPRAVLPVKLGGRVVPEHILRDVQVFMLLTFAVGAAVVVAERRRLRPEPARVRQYSFRSSIPA
jgi:hypothetical protein